ncbi:MAG: hypothetical protein KatS3mg081_0314 [Gemmatimonadales bacterium]|nr:MAG: hypothetical protein KatS3mg081_0314 [Gemmatimonadales bacterium]
MAGRNRAILAVITLSVRVGFGAYPALDLQAQAVRGTILDRTSRLPVSRAFVVLLDTAGTEVARALTDDQGRFFLSAPAAGSYRVQSKRIGFRPTVSSMLNLGAGVVQDFRLEVEAVPMTLPAEVVIGRPRCGAIEGPVVADLWGEIREALAAVSWTSRRPYRYRKVIYEREVDLSGRTVRRERSRERTGYFETPFRSASPRSLAEQGYVRQEGNRRLFYGPDVDVLRSDQFIGTHCFSAVSGGGADSGLVGLRFEPIRGRSLPDIAGTLWVDRATAELRRLEFTYVNLPGDLGEVALGGKVSFLALPSGEWIVRDWSIATPLRAYVQTFTERELRVVGLQQSGGMVLEITDSGRPIYTAAQATLSGLVFDDTRGVPLPGAGVQLLETPYATTTDGFGRFVLRGAMEGEYRVTFTHPRLDSLAHVPEPVGVRLSPGHATGIRLSIPAESVLVRELCPDTAGMKETFVLHGVVRDPASRAAVPGAEVRASWQDIRGWVPGMPIVVEGRLRPLIVREPWAATVTDSLGRYLLCGLPFERGITVTAQQARTAAHITVSHERTGVRVGEAWTPYDGRIWPLDLELRRETAPPGFILGVVIDGSSGEPLANAIVSLTGLDIQAVSSRDGNFRLEGVPPGTHGLVVRRIGYEVLERAVTVRGGDTVRLVGGVLALKALPFVLDTMVVRGEREEEWILEQVGFNERRKMGFGDFVTRREFEPYFPAEIADVLKRFSSLGVRPNPNYLRPWRGGQTDPRRWIVGHGDSCPALFFLNGVFIGDGSRVDLESLLDVNQIEAIEVYTGTAQIPVIFNRTGSRCGVVAFWTRR